MWVNSSKVLQLSFSLLVSIMSLNANSALPTGLKGVAELTPEDERRIQLEIDKIRAAKAQQKVDEQLEKIDGGVVSTTEKVVKAITPTPQSVNSWAEVGANIGKGLVGAARELGSAANDFAKTDVGKLTVVIIVWKMMGKELSETTGNGLRFVIKLGFMGFLPLLWYLGFRFYFYALRPATIEYDTTKLFKKVKSVQRSPITEDEKATLVIFSVLLIVAEVATLISL